MGKIYSTTIGLQTIKGWRSREGSSTAHESCKPLSCHSEIVATQILNSQETPVIRIALYSPMKSVTLLTTSLKIFRNKPAASLECSYIGLI